jgi:hypothetical protein
MTAFPKISILVASAFLAAVTNAFQVGPSKVASAVPRICAPSFPRHYALLAKENDPTKSLSCAAGSSSALRLSLIAEATDVNTVQFLQNSDFWVFLAGVFPFAWATVEFWRRIAFGEAFGTGSDQVIIGMDDAPSDSRGRVVLGKGALYVAYILFAVSFGTIGIVFYSVISSGAPPEILPSQELSLEAVGNILEN